MPEKIPAIAASAGGASESSGERPIEPPTCVAVWGATRMSGGSVDADHRRHT